MRTVELNIKVTANEAMVWQDEHLYLLDQRLLPHQSVFIQSPKITEFIESDKALWYKTRRFAAMVQQNNYSTHVSQLLDLGAG